MKQESTTPDLSNAETPEQIINAVATAIWRKQNNKGEPPIPTLEGLQAFTAAAEARGWVVTSNPSRYFVYTSEQHQELEIKLHNSQEIAKRLTIRFFESDEGKRYLAMSSSEQEEWHKETRQRVDRVISEIEWQKAHPDSDVQLATDQDIIEASYILPPEHFQPIAAYLLRNAGEPTTGALLWLHQAWMIARKDNQELKHPLATLVRAWLDYKTAKRINAEYDRKHPAAILKHPMGSIREIAFTETDPATLKEFARPQRTEQANPDQFRFEFAQEGRSVLPAIMPLEIAHPMGLQPTTKSGAVSHVVRVFFEALMALEPNQRQTELRFRLGDLINYLYPGYITEEGKKNHKAFNRSNQLPHIIKALEILHFYATVPWIDDQGDLRRWRPVTVKSPLERTSKNDTPIFMGVDLPPDAKQGYLIIKKTHRELGKASAPQFNAYHTAAWLWDKHGTTPKGIIDPSRPIERRDAEGRLLDGQGNIILNSKGKPVNDLYNSASIKQLPREYNPKADRYPVLSDSDLLFACYPSGYKGNKSTYIKRAKEHWKEMEKQGIITIREERGGWRIMPGGEHLNLHRGVKKASTKKR